MLFDRCYQKVGVEGRRRGKERCVKMNRRNSRRTGERGISEETDRKLRYTKKRKDIRYKKDKQIENG